MQTAAQGAAAAAGHVAQGLVARAMAQSAPALAGAPLYAGALDAMAAAAAAKGAGHVVRRALGGGGPPPDAGVSASAVEIPGGLSFAEVRQLFEQPKPVPIDRMFVERGAPRDGAAVLAMQRSHDLAGGSAPHLDIRAINGWSDGYGPWTAGPGPRPSDPFDP